MIFRRYGFHSAQLLQIVYRNAMKFQLDLVLALLVYHQPSQKLLYHLIQADRHHYSLDKKLRSIMLQEEHKFYPAILDTGCQQLLQGDDYQYQIVLLCYATRPVPECFHQEYPSHHEA